MSSRDVNEWSRKLAVDSSIEWIDNLIAVHERGVADLKRYRERFIEATQKKDSLATPVNVLSWTVNEVQNIQRNLRLDMVANHAAALALTEKKD
jgi:hypothetical protein